MYAIFYKKTFVFRFPAGTSRGTLNEKPSFFILLENNGFRGVGECSVIPDLSIDDLEQIPHKLGEICNLINRNEWERIDFEGFPSIAFGLEMALLDLKRGGEKVLFPSDFTDGKRGIAINGLVWMGEKDFMQKQIREKIDAGFRCIKLKIGALRFDTELEIIAAIRKNFSERDIEIRLDANGGFSPTDALEKLKILSNYKIHSVEQPIKPQQWEAMAAICETSPIAVALDEELIGIKANTDILESIKPQFLILKPSLIGGFSASEKWIALAEKQQIGWWITSALESNIGLNALAQWAFTKKNPLPQGLGTGLLYKNNFPSPLEIKNAELWHTHNII